MFVTVNLRPRLVYTGGSVAGRPHAMRQLEYRERVTASMDDRGCARKMQCSGYILMKVTDPIVLLTPVHLDFVHNAALYTLHSSARLEHDSGTGSPMASPRKGRLFAFDTVFKLLEWTLAVNTDVDMPLVLFYTHDATNGTLSMRYEAQRNADIRNLLVEDGDGSVVWWVPHVTEEKLRATEVFTTNLPGTLLLPLTCTYICDKSLSVRGAFSKVVTSIGLTIQ